MPYHLNTVSTPHDQTRTFHSIALEMSSSRHFGFTLQVSQAVATPHMLDVALTYSRGVAQRPAPHEEKDLSPERPRRCRARGGTRARTLHPLRSARHPAYIINVLHPAPH